MSLPFPPYKNKSPLTRFLTAHRIAPNTLERRTTIFASPVTPGRNPSPVPAHPAHRKLPRAPAGGRWTEYNGLMSVDNGLMATDKRLMSADKRLMSIDNGLMSTDKRLMSWTNG